MSATTTIIPTGTYDVDPAHSRVEFSVKHLGIAKVKGSFGEFRGSLELSGDDVSQAKAYGSVTAASVNTAEPQRDEHLRSADFFDVASNPTIDFASTAIRPVDEDVFEIAGDFTMHGVTRELVLRAEIQGTETDPYGNERVALEVTGELSRSDYGMTFNQMLGSGNMLVSDKVKLSLDISAIKRS